MRLVRRDMLPENARYPDEGCELADYCLRCPLPVCKEDDPTLNTRLRKADRNREIVKALATREAAKSIARRFGMGTRTVFRIGKQAREGYVSPRFEETAGDPDITLDELALASSFRVPDPLPKLFG